MSDNIQIAVRVRPFNDREKNRNSKCVVEMNGDCTIIRNPDNPAEEPKKFTFDHSYWSFDGYEETDGVAIAKKGSSYADQSRVFKELGETVLESAWNGFNAALLAYGQTGAGKSFSMFGYGKNQGIIPTLCSKLFGDMQAKQSAQKQYRLSFSMMEIYNEKIRDLLSGSGDDFLKIRQNPKIGFYCEGLKDFPVTSYAEIEKLMERGMQSRTIAATKMNDTSSRAHTILVLNFFQVDVETNTEKRSNIMLCDLAGSERLKDAQTTGTHLKETSSINTSLSVLGQVIQALVQLQQGKKNVVVPYRDSVLTKLLQNALGGNSKTIMIAAISPADINYEETLSTLRFADRAKSIKNKAVINENQTDRLIRELKEENERLKKQLGGKGMDSAEVEKLKQQMAEQEMVLAEMNKSWTDKVEEARSALSEVETQSSAVKEKARTTPYIRNLNEDPLLSGALLFFIEEGRRVVGRNKADIKISGVGINPEHATLTWENRVLKLKALANSAVRINGVVLKTADEKQLNNNDRILFGTSSIYVVHLPGAVQPKKPITWQDAQVELARAQGFARSDNDPVEMKILFEDIIELLPLVNEINQIAVDLEKYRRFEIVIKSNQYAAGAAAAAAPEKGKNPPPKPSSSKTKANDIAVKVVDDLQGFKWLWDAETFRAFRERVYDAYSLYFQTEIKDVDAGKADPFLFAPQEWLVGIASVPLKSLTYLIDVYETVMIHDYKGSNEGLLKVVIKMEGFNADEVGGDVKELVGKGPIKIIVQIENACGLRVKVMKSIRCRFSFLSAVNQDTPAIEFSPNPEFNYQQVFKVPKMTEDIVNKLSNDSFIVEVWGEPQDSAEANAIAAMKKARHVSTTGQTDTSALASPTGDGNHKRMDSSQQLTSVETAMKSQKDRLDHLHQLIVDGLNKNERLETSAKTQQVEIDNLKAEITRLNMMHSKRTIDHEYVASKLRKEIVAKCRTIVEETRVLSQLRTEMAVLRGDHAQQQSLVKSLQYQNQKLQRRVESGASCFNVFGGKSKIDELTKQVQDLQERKTEEDAEMGILKKELEEFRSLKYHEQKGKLERMVKEVEEFVNEAVRVVDDEKPDAARSFKMDDELKLGLFASLSRGKRVHPETINRGGKQISNQSLPAVKKSAADIAEAKKGACVIL